MNKLYNKRVSVPQLDFPTHKDKPTLIEADEESLKPATQQVQSVANEEKKTWTPMLNATLEILY